MTADRARGTERVALLEITGKIAPAQTTMNGQSLAQSGLAGWSGQQGMPSGMSIEFDSTAAAAIDIDIAVAGVASGASTSPSHARAANQWRMVNWHLTSRNSHIR
jgi:hypothetical protein